MAREAAVDGDSRTTSLRWGVVLLVVAITAAAVGQLPDRVRYVIVAGLVIAAVVLMVRPSRRGARRGNEAVLDDSELVRVAVAPNRPEAEVLRGMLQANGIGCHVRQTDFGAGSMDGMPGGPHQVLVQETDARRARELLARTP